MTFMEKKLFYISYFLEKYKFFSSSPSIKERFTSKIFLILIIMFSSIPNKPRWDFMWFWMCCFVKPLWHFSALVFHWLKVRIFFCKSQKLVFFPKFFRITRSFWIPKIFFVFSHFKWFNWRGKRLLEKYKPAYFFRRFWLLYWTAYLISII